MIRLILIALLALGWGLDHTYQKWEYARLQDELDDRTAQLSLDHELLQTLWNGQYDREKIELTSVTVSAYSSTKDQTDDTPFVNAHGSDVFVGQVAVSRDLMSDGLTFGSVVWIPEVGLLRVTDVMNARWKRRMDVWCPSREAAKRFGVKDDATVVWMRGV